MRLAPLAHATPGAGNSVDAVEVSGLGSAHSNGRAVGGDLGFDGYLLALVEVEHNERAFCYRGGGMGSKTVFCAAMNCQVPSVLCATNFMRVLSTPSAGGVMPGGIA